MMRIAPCAAGRHQFLTARIVFVHRVAVRGARFEHGNLADQAAGRNADDEHRSTLSARKKSVVLVQLTRRHVDLFRGQRSSRACGTAAERLRERKRGRGGDDDENQRMAFNHDGLTRRPARRACADAVPSCCTAWRNRSCSAPGYQP